ncbi:MAG: HAD-IC family P-type ATPase [Verrucomicrobiota bacterium]
MLEEGGYLRFYELKGNTVVPPMGSKVFKNANLDWVENEQIKAEDQSSNGQTRASFQIEGISCIGCVWLIEAIFKESPGNIALKIDSSSSLLELCWHKDQFSLVDFAERLQRIGYQISPPSERPRQSKVTSQIEALIGLAGFFLLNTMLFTLPTYLGMSETFFLAPLFRLLAAFFSTLSLAICGGYFIKRAVLALRRKVLHIDLPIAAGLVAAYAGSLIGWALGYSSLLYFDFVATFVFLMLVGRWVQEFAIERNQAHLQKHFQGPGEVTLIGGHEDGENIQADEVKKDQSYSISPGAINPVAAHLIDENAALSLEWINGEPEPVEWKIGTIVPAGSINVSSETLRLKADESWSDSLLAELLQPVENSITNNKIQRILKTYLLFVIILSGLGGGLWLLFGGGLLKALQVFISILIVSCPCALGVTLPLCDQIALRRLRKMGLFVKNPSLWAALRKVKTIVFDKTGTLTMEVPRLKNPDVIENLSLKALRATYILSRKNTHPVARSILHSILAHKASLSNTLSLEHQITKETIGKGVLWVDQNDNQWTLGKPVWKAKVDEIVDQSANAALRLNGKLVAKFFIQEDLRDDAREVVHFFHQENLATAILSGDRKERVYPIADDLKIPRPSVRSECDPYEKARWIEEEAFESALMIGDGANDSMAFKSAICRGTPVVDRNILEASSDFFFFGRSLKTIPSLFKIAKQRHQTIRNVFWAAISYNCIAVALCLSGHMHPLLAAILMPLSSIATLVIAWFGLGKKSSRDSF